MKLQLIGMLRRKNVFEFVDQVNKLKESLSKSTAHIGVLEINLVELTIDRDRSMKNKDILGAFLRKRNLGMKQLEKENAELKEVNCSI